MTVMMPMIRLIMMMSMIMLMVMIVMIMNIILTMVLMFFFEGDYDHVCNDPDDGGDDDDGDDEHDDDGDVDVGRRTSREEPLVRGIGLREPLLSRALKHQGGQERAAPPVGLSKPW